jgi:hypothetical protein
MAHFGDWVPSREQDLVDLGVKWIDILGDTNKQVTYGWDPATCTFVIGKITAFLTARAAYEQVNSTENRITKDEA